MRLHNTIHKLPLTIFIDIMVSKDLSLLVIEGEPTQEELTTTWQNIISEYSQAISSKEVSIKMDSLTELMQLETIIRIGDTLVRILEMNPKKETFELLYEFGYNLPQKEYSEDNLKVILPIFLGHFRLDKHKYSILSEHKEKQAKNQEKKQDFDYEYFNDMISEIGINLNTHLDIDKIMTGVFCSYMNKLQKYIKNKKQ